MHVPFLMFFILTSLLVGAQQSMAAVSGAIESPREGDNRYYEERNPRRLALVIGNYEYRYHGDLPGVESDVKNVAKAFRDIGFDFVSVHENVETWETFQFDVLKPFRAQVQRDDLVVVYVSGHGFAFNGFQYFAPAEMPKQLEEGSVSTNAIPIETVVNLFDAEGPGAVLRAMSEIG